VAHGAFAIFAPRKLPARSFCSAEVTFVPEARAAAMLKWASAMSPTFVALTTYAAS
jgi:hypothetical protein